MPPEAHTLPLPSSGFEVELHGCRPEPLASYLKALAVLRLVAEQHQHDAQGFWRGDRFVLRSTLDRAGLLAFFADQWHPTPVIAPWNGGSGFYPKDNRQAADAIIASTDPRLGDFARTITIARDDITARGLDKRPDGAEKLAMVGAMRATLPDVALAWLDAAIVIGDERLLFPPMLGTGGNDGRLDFTNNFQQRVVEVLTNDVGTALATCLFAEPSKMSFRGTMGQFHPAAHDRSNPWDFVLLIEGALLLAGAATRRLESTGPAMIAFPFHARSGAGLATLTDEDAANSRDEVWLPLWSSPATLREIGRLFAEGRATVGHGKNGRRASSALDFGRAVTSLGVDRGISEFCRVGFQLRNGLAYFATPLGRFKTAKVSSSRLLDDIDPWYDRFRRKATDRHAPGAVASAHRRLEAALFEAATRGTLGPTLLALAQVERALARSLGFTIKAFLSPVPRLSSAWAPEADNGSCEQRLAGALAGRPGMRRRWIPLDRFGANFGRGDDVSCVFSERGLVPDLHALLLREDLEELQGKGMAVPEPLHPICSLTDIAQFIAGDTDDTLIENWLRALALVEDPRLSPPPEEALLPPATYGVLTLVHHRRVGAELIPRTPGVLVRACAGDAVGATSAAIRRLAASGRPLPVRALLEPRELTRRIAAALAFPLTVCQRRKVEALLLPAPTSASTHHRRSLHD